MRALREGGIRPKYVASGHQLECPNFLNEAFPPARDLGATTVLHSELIRVLSAVGFGVFTDRELTLYSCAIPGTFPRWLTALTSLKYVQGRRAFVLAEFAR